jgi:hypothetical protein
MRVVAWSTGERQLTPVHNWNVGTHVPCAGDGETRCELYPCVNALYTHKTEVRPVMWLQEADGIAEGVFAREDIEAGTFVLDFGELRLASAIESSAQWCGWRLRFDVESKLSSVTKTFVVKDSEFRDCGDSGIARGGKVNSTCCRVHKNAELVPDSGECSEGVGVVCARSAHQSVTHRALACFIGGHSGTDTSGVPVLEDANKPVLIEQHA